MYAHATAAVATHPVYPMPAMCKGLARDAVSRISAISSLQSVKAGKALFTEGDDADNVYEVVRGMLKLYKLLPDGRRQIMGFLSAGDLLGLSFSGVYSYTAEAITDLTLCHYSRASFDRLVDEVPGFARRLLAVRSDELRAAQDQMLLLGRKMSVEKMSSFLLTLGDRQNEAEGNIVDIPMSRNDIADYLGLTIETVSRTITKLKSMGVIRALSSAKIALVDRDRLQDLAEGGSDEDF